MQGALFDLGARAPQAYPMRRAWAMPNHDTLSIPPIAELVSRWSVGRPESMDPFARNSRAAKYRNDLNPDTLAEHHMDAGDFCKKVSWDCGLGSIDLVIFDPPYSLRQVKECYAGVGRKMSGDESRDLSFTRVKDLLMPLIRRGGIVISFGWNSGGFGEERGFELRELLLVAHGGHHNDTIVVVEERTEGGMKVSS